MRYTLESDIWYKIDLIHRFVVHLYRLQIPEEPCRSVDKSDASVTSGHQAVSIGCVPNGAVKP